MKRNEKILAAGLAIVIVGYFGWPMIDSIFFAPTRDLQDQADLLQAQVTKAGDEKVQLLVAERQLDAWKRQSLPADPYEAQRLYQQWLSDFSEACGLDCVVTPTSRRNTAGGVYTTIPVELKGRATFGELQVFLQRFYEIDLLQRVFELKIPSVPAAEGDPEFPFELTAEGLSIAGAPERNPLFPQHELKSQLTAEATSFEVPKAAFPAKAGDLLRISNELALVTERSDDAVTMKRAVDGTKAVEHAAGTIAELLPLKSEARQGPSAFAQIESPFVKPRKYAPAFDGFTDQKLERGKSLQLAPQVAGYDRSAGTPKIELVSGPDGLSFDAKQGTLSWTPKPDLPAGDYKISLVAEVPAPQKKLEKTITVSLVDPNTPPKFEPVPTAEVFLGETLNLPMKVSDAQDGTALNYKVEGAEGASVDAAKGELVWAVPKTLTPGDVNVTVTASDKGSPPLEAKQSITVKVKEDLRPFVFMTHTGSDTIDGKKTWKAWLTDRSSGRTLSIYEGKSFEAAGLTGVVKEIGDDHVTFERNESLWKIMLGQNLKDATRLDGPVAEASQRAPTEAERPEPGQPATAAVGGIPAS